MSPPPTSIDGTDITGATIDGQEVQEITIDGQTVFTAVPPGAFDLAQYTLDKSINSEDNEPKDIAFDDVGSRLYEIGVDGDNIYQSSLSKPFDIGTATFDKSINTQEATQLSLAFDNSGSRLYHVGRDAIFYQFSLTTPFDIGTASLQKTASTPATRPNGLAFDDTGSRVYTIHNEFSDAGINIFQLGLSTAFDITTATVQKSINPEDTRPQSIAFNNDGTRLYQSHDGFGNNGAKIYQSSLSTPFDIGTASLQKSINSQDNRPAITFDNNGSRLYEAGDDTDTIFQLSV